MRTDSGEQGQRAPSSTGRAPRGGKGLPLKSRVDTRQRDLQQQRRQAVEPAPRVAQEVEPPLPHVPLGIVAARTIVVSSLGLAAAAGVFLLVGGFWRIGLGALAAAAILILLMFLIERLAPCSCLSIKCSITGCRRRQRAKKPPTAGRG